MTIRLNARAAAVAALAILLGGCSSATATTPSPNAAAPGLGIHGSIYLLAGPDGFTMDVYRWDGGTVAPHRLTTSPHGQGVDMLTAAAGKVIIDAAPLGIGGHFAQLASPSGPFNALDYKLPDRAGTPQLSLDGSSLAYVEGRAIDLEHNKWLDVIHVLDLHTMRDREAYSSAIPTFLIQGSWAPDGTICFIHEVRGGAYQVKAVAPNGTARVLLPHTDPVSGVAWSSRGLLAVGVRGRAETDVFDRQGQQIGTLSGWAPLSWSPDGSQLVLISETPAPGPPDNRTGPGRDLAVVGATELSRPQRVGRFPGYPVWQGAWFQ